MALLNWLETCLRRYLDRLPRSDRTDIGAGYTMAAAAVATVLVLVIFVLFYIFLGVYVSGMYMMAPIELLVIAAVVLCFVIPGGFLGGVTVWRFVPESLRSRGRVGGLLATIVSFAVSSILLFVVLPYFDDNVAYSVDEFIFAMGVLSMYFLLTSWLSVPIGVVAGYLYERSRQ